jgi:hypothetical protein
MLNVKSLACLATVIGSIGCYGASAAPLSSGQLDRPGFAGITGRLPSPATLSRVTTMAARHDCEANWIAAPYPRQFGPVKPEGQHDLNGQILKPAELHGFAMFSEPIDRQPPSGPLTS